MSQIKKKFIADRAVDGSKILLLNNQPIKALIDNGEFEQELFKFSNMNKFEFLISPSIGGYAVDADSMVNKQFVDREVGNEATARATAVSTEQSRAEAAESLLSGRLSTVEGADSVPGSVAKSLKDSKSYTDAAITSLINGAPGMLDTLKEIADAIEADESVGAALASTVASNLQEAKDYTDTEVSAERSRAMALEELLVGDLIQEELRAMGEESRIEGKVDQEISDRQSAVSAEESRAEGEEARIEGLVTSEAARALAAEGVLSSAISAETTRAQGQEAAIETRFVNDEAAHSAEVARAMGEEERIEGKVDQEISDRQSAISSEQSARGTAVSSSLQEAKDYTDAQILEEEELRDAETSALSSRLDIVEGEDSVEGSVAKAEKDAKEFASAEVLTEKNRAEAAESGLQSAINTEKGRVDSILLASDADKDSFAEIVQLINSVDTTNDTAFASYVLSNNSALSQEVSDRQSAVSAEESRAEGEESRIEGLLTQEVSDRETAVSTARNAAIGLVNGEQSRAEAAEAGLQTQLDQEISDRQSAVSTEQSARQSAVSGLQNQLDNEVSQRVAAVSAASASAELHISEEMTRALAAEAVLSSAISAEQSRAQGMESGLQGQITALDVSRQSAQNVILGYITALQEVQAGLPRKETMEVSAEQASQGYIDLSMQAMEHSVHMFVGPLYAVEGIDYSVSVEGGVTRITFMGQLASGGVSEITSGDQVQVKYMK